MYKFHWNVKQDYGSLAEADMSHGMSDIEDNPVPEDPMADIGDEAALSLLSTDLSESEFQAEEPDLNIVPLGSILEEMKIQRSQAAEDKARDLVPNTRLPPSATDAERALIGGLLIDPSSFERTVEEGLRPSDFYRKAHGIIYNVIQDLFQSAEPVDALTVVDELQRRGQLELVGGATGVSQLEALIPTAAHVGAYARLVREKSTLRRLIESATEIVAAAFRQDQKVIDLIDDAERAILAISEENTKKGVVPMGELVQRAISQLEKAYENKNSITGVPSGFTDFDSKTCGLQPGELIIIAARPSMGKTALTLNIASYVAVRKNIPVAVFSLEMGAEQLVQRLLGAQAGIDLSRIRKGQIKSTEWTDMARAAGELSEAPVYIDETPGLSIAELRTKARRMHHEHGIQLLIIDYLQLMSGPPGYENKATEVGEISKGLKSLARELSIPVIALSQLNRGVESRTDKRPMMSDLRESGAIEQDADLIAFLYREEYYLKDKTPEDKIGVAELIIGKHRNGPTGTLELQFKSELTRFENLTRQYDDYVP
jgi:replicative DNA helicase